MKLFVNISIVSLKLSKSIVLPLLLKDDILVLLLYLPLLLKDGVLVLLLIGRFLKFLKARKEISEALSVENHVENHL